MILDSVIGVVRKIMKTANRKTGRPISFDKNVALEAAMRLFLGTRLKNLPLFRHDPVLQKPRFDVFTRVGPDNSLECLAERSVGLVTDRPSDVYELFVTPS
jgi:hypothetical protein